MVEELLNKNNIDNTKDNPNLTKNNIKKKSKRIKPKLHKPHKANNFLLDTIFSYSTVRLARIHNKKIAFLFRFIQLSIISYVIGWSIIYKRGYQQMDQISSTVSTKVKGLGYVLDKFGNKTIRGNNYGRIFVNSNNISIFDPADYVIPAVEYNSIFIMTNFIKTKQTRGICEEDFRNKGCQCDNNLDCEENLEITNAWNGFPTGNCIKSSIKPDVKVCEIATWCPVEIDSIDKHNIIKNVENYTIFIKNDVKFETFNKRHRNLLTNITNQYIKTCNYEPMRDPFCPVFTVKEILNQAEPDPKERQRMLRTGGLIRIRIEWNCNYDFFSKQCLPRYSFDRFDVPYKDISSASGYNFRHSDRYAVNGITYRELTKAYGLRFVITVTGQAGKFNFLPLLLTLGSGIGLLSLATIITDVILLNMTSKRKFYRELKEHNYKKQLIYS